MAACHVRRRMESIAMSEQTSPLNVELLYCDHHGWLQGWLRRKLGNSFDAADLAHDTFVRIMASRRLPPHLGDEPRALLTHVAKGLVVDHWRRREVEAAYLETVANLPHPEVPSPEARLLIIEALVRIDAMLASLPPRTRQVFLLAQLDGLTLRQIVEQTQMPLITVRRHIHRALMACMAAA